MLVEQRPEIRDLAWHAAQFRPVLEAARDRIGPQDWSWYRYDSLGLFQVLDRMLTGPRRRLLDLTGEGRLLDIGCGDGALAFFFESQGLNVTAIDHSATNCNRMQGVRELKTALGSKIEILDLDVDNSSLPRAEEPYGLALVLGILYHLRNPVHLLDEVGKCARYCLLSTRVARFTPDRTLDLERQPVAYLVDSSELNADPTNYWIFSQTGLTRLFRRTGWRIADRLNVGATGESDPVRAEADERCYCLLERADLADKASAPDSPVHLSYGWYARGQGEHHWQWTAGAFGLAVSSAELTGPRTLVLQLYVSPILTDRLGTITLSAAARGRTLQKESYSTPGAYSFTVAAPASAEELRIDFTLDKYLPESADDSRELGLIVSEIELR